MKFRLKNLFFTAVDLSLLFIKYISYKTFPPNLTSAFVLNARISKNQPKSGKNESCSARKNTHSNLTLWTHSLWSIEDELTVLSS